MKQTLRSRFCVVLALLLSFSISSSAVTIADVDLDLTPERAAILSCQAFSFLSLWNKDTDSLRFLRNAELDWPSIKKTLTKGAPTTLSDEDLRLYFISDLARYSNDQRRKAGDIEKLAPSCWRGDAATNPEELAPVEASKADISGDKLTAVP
jgi:hypothetical protein